jgi:hypothetical protein
MTKLAPIAKRVYLTGTFAGYNVVFKDNTGTVVIRTMEVPTAGMGHAIVRAIREYATARDGRLF